MKLFTGLVGCTLLLGVLVPTAQAHHDPFGHLTNDIDIQTFSLNGATPKQCSDFIQDHLFKTTGYSNGSGGNGLNYPFLAGTHTEILDTTDSKMKEAVIKVSCGTNTNPTGVVVIYSDAVSSGDNAKSMAKFYSEELGKLKK
jgi:hypothetical protein